MSLFYTVFKGSILNIAFLCSYLKLDFIRSWGFIMTGVYLDMKMEKVLMFVNTGFF